MAPTSSTLQGNDFPEDLLLLIISYLQCHDLYGLMCSCKRFYGIVVPIVYRTLRLDFPPLVYTNTAEVNRPVRLLVSLMLSLRHTSSNGDSARFHPQFIQSISYVSFDPLRDLRAFPMFATILCFTSNLRHLQVDIADDSIDIAMDLLRRRGILRSPPGSMLDVLRMPPSIPCSLSRLESIRSTKLVLVAAFLEQHPLKSASIDHAVPLKELAPLLPYSPPVSRNTLTKLSLGVYSHSTDFTSVIRGIGSSFPLLQHLAVRCPARVGASFLQAMLDILTTEDLLLGLLDVISLNHGSRRRAYADILQDALVMVGALGDARPRLRQVILGRAMAMRLNAQMPWAICSGINMQEWPWLLRSTWEF